MIRRSISMFAGGICAALASQAPEFAQQYSQRLGGAVEELRAVVSLFDKDANKAGINRSGGLDRLAQSTDPFIAARSESMRLTIDRFTQLDRQQTAMKAPDVLTRVGAMVKDYDGKIAEDAMKDFRPAIPLSLEGMFFGLIGFFGGATVAGVAALPMGRRKPRQATA
ncbi:MAG: DUF2937 family protein [Beijerinckiaceae bacterium]